MRTLCFSALMAVAILSSAAQSEGAMGPGGRGSDGGGFSGSRGGSPGGFTSGGRGYSGDRGSMPGGFTSSNRMFPGNRPVAFRGGRPNWGGPRSTGFDHDRFGNHGFFRHDRSFFFFSLGVPWCYYPSYGYYPAYSYPVYAPYPASYYPDTYVPTPYVYDSGASYSSPASSPAVQVRTWLELGHDWAKDLRLDIVAWDQLVAYVKAYVINASPTVRDEFRRGFLSGYGLHAQEAYDKALKQAVESAAADQNTAPPATPSIPPAPSSPPGQ